MFPALLPVLSPVCPWAAADEDQHWRRPRGAYLARMRVLVWMSIVCPSSPSSCWILHIPCSPGLLLAWQHCRVRKDRAPLGEKLCRGEGTGPWGPVQACPGLTANSEPRSLPPGITDHEAWGRRAGGDIPWVEPLRGFLKEDVRAVSSEGLRRTGDPVGHTELMKRDCGEIADSQSYLTSLPCGLLPASPQQTSLI